LNQDAYLQEDTIEKLIKVHKDNTDYGIISPIHLNGSGSNLDKNFSNYFKKNDTIFYDTLKNTFKKNIYEVPFMNAAAWLLPKKTLEVIGGFDPIFHHYAEDDNYCQRVLFHGFKIGVVPDIYIYHDREFREPIIKNTIKDKLILKERYLKHKWANISAEVDTDIKTNKKNHLKLIVKLFLKLKLKKANYYIKELALIKKIIPEIENSREINRTKGRHYIN
jgi:GT2 family glycosyltransferase